MVWAADDAVRSPPVQHPSAFRRTGRPGVVTGLAVVALLLGACDTGDGTTLRDPTAPTTQPPPDTAPLSTEAISTSSDPSGDQLTADTIASTFGEPADDVASFSSPNGLAATTPWVTGGVVERRYTCDGSDASPAVTWDGVPDGTTELAVAVVDESDVSAGRPFIHWVISGLSPTAGGLGENEQPPGSAQGINFFGDVGYTGPCPDPGVTNTYSLTVYALSQQLEIADGTPAAEMLDFITTTAFDSASILGTASR